MGCPRGVMGKALDCEIAARVHVYDTNMYMYMYMDDKNM